MFNRKVNSAQMLGRFQPWHTGHKELFKESLNRVGQVCIMVRDMPISEKNPFTFEEIKERIELSLGPEYEGTYEVISVPNITNIFYGRDVGYKIDYINLPEDIQAISATKIREELNKEK
jgi:nicotinamide mononucleotide adenylyltransferase